jgi:ABC-type glycerol-3-phosphate transport system substrate-binding protein
MRLKLLLAVLALVMVTLACGGQGQQADRFTFWTPTPDASPTPIVVEVVETQVIVVEITPTPVPPQAVEKMCVSATVAVYLRPSPSDDNYPIMSLPNGAELTDLGGRDGSWLFVQYGDAQGWVNGSYVGSCGQ